MENLDKNERVIKFWSNIEGKPMGEIQALEPDCRVTFKGEVNIIQANKPGSVVYVEPRKGSRTPLEEDWFLSLLMTFLFICIDFIIISIFVSLIK